jgi:hypothetical protein
MPKRMRRCSKLVFGCGPEEEGYEVGPGVIRGKPILVHVERTNLE